MTIWYQKNKTLLPLFIVIIFLLFGGINCITSYLFYQEYQSKMNLLTEVATKSERSGIDIAIDWMKGKDDSAEEEGKQLLKQYGYWDSKENGFYLRWKHNIMITCGVSAIIGVFLFYFICYWRNQEAKRQQTMLKHLEQILVQFRENNFEVLLEEDKDIFYDRLIFQLEAIGRHIQMLKEKAREEKESTKAMVSDISHQLKTPVAALDTCFSVLLENQLSAIQQNEFAIRCRSALNELDILLHSLLQISKLEVGLIQISKEKYPLVDTILSAINCVYVKADEKNIEFSFDSEEGNNHCIIMQDRKWLREALVNVLDNAIKYSFEHSNIFIRIQKRTNFIRIEIEDEGIGIPQNEYHKIFQRFYRGSLPRIKETSGSGIGLFLSREIIEKHGGTITVVSGREIKGSIFIIQLPLEC